MKMLTKFQLLSADGNLSITNLALFVLIGKIAFMSVLDWTVLIAFLLALVNYNAKRYHSHVHQVQADLKTNATEAAKARVAKLEADMRQLLNVQSAQKLGGRQ